MGQSRKSLADLAIMLGINPRHRGRENLRKAILRKIRQAEKQAMQRRKAENRFFSEIIKLVKE